jgi:hypothetical protein
MKNLLNVSREYANSYNKYSDCAKMDFPLTADAYWQISRRRLPRPSFIGFDEGKFNKKLDREVYDVIIRFLDLVDVEPDYKLESKSVHPQLGLNVYTFSGRGLSNYQTPFNYLSKEAPKIEIA